MNTIYVIELRVSNIRLLEGRQNHTPISINQLKYVGMLNEDMTVLITTYHKIKSLIYEEIINNTSRIKENIGK